MTDYVGNFVKYGNPLNNFSVPVASQEPISNFRWREGLVSETELTFFLRELPLFSSLSFSLWLIDVSFAVIPHVFIFIYLCTSQSLRFIFWIKLTCDKYLRQQHKNLINDHIYIYIYLFIIHVIVQLDYIHILQL